MPCSGCSSNIAAMVGGHIKYWCPSDGTYKYDWEVCAPVYDPNAVAPQPVGPAPPNVSGTIPVNLAAPPNAMANGSGCCGCSGMGAGSPSGPIYPNAPPLTSIGVAGSGSGSSSSSLLATSGCCGKCKTPQWLEILGAIALALLAWNSLKGER